MQASTLDLAHRLHAEALEAASRFKDCEIDLIEKLQRIESARVFTLLGYNSLFKYATGALSLSDEVAYIYINVARKAREVPALKEEIRSGAITVSKARTISSVLSPTNQEKWIGLAKTSSKRELERQVAIASPKHAVPEKVKYVSSPMLLSDQSGATSLSSDRPTEVAKVMQLGGAVRVNLQIGLNESTMLKLRRAQDILSQKRRVSCSLEDVIQEMTGMYLQKIDPVEIAKRQDIRGKLKPQLFPGTVGNRSLPSSLKHQVQLKFAGQCGHVDENGMRCTSRRFLEIHHIRALENGGSNDFENLILLCAGHHKVVHTI